MPKKYAKNFYETDYGKFYINPDLLTTISISPSFERDDINYLKSLIKKELNNKKRVLFLDIGAYVGLYSILVGNYFKKFSRLNIIAFEPNTNYLSSPTYELLKRNISENKIKNIKLKKIGVGSTKKTNEEGISVDTLENILGSSILKRTDVLFIKLDIDDFVIDGLKGITSFVDKADKSYLFVEDFIKRKEVVEFLEKNNFNFIDKKTEYNSFWEK